MAEQRVLFSLKKGMHGFGSPDTKTIGVTKGSRAMEAWGYEFLHWCEVEPWVARAYVEGLLDTVVAFQYEGKVPKIICVPDGRIAETITQFCQYLRENPVPQSKFVQPELLEFLVKTRNCN